MEAVLLNDSPIGHHSSDKVFPLNELIDHFSVFKGIGKKSAQRLALESILLAPEKVQRFADSLVYARQNIRFCVDCYYLTWGTKCHVCLDEARNKQQLCVVSEPKDVLAIDQSRTYKGLFHVLGGVISPLDGVYPEMLRCKELKTRIIQLILPRLTLTKNLQIKSNSILMIQATLI